MRFRKEKYKPGQVVPHTGVYRVVHKKHRPAHENSLLRGMKFPACEKCGDQVRFEVLVSLSDAPTPRGFTKSPSLLLVEDTPAVAATLSWVFEGEGYDVSTAESYSKAVGLLSARDYDAVITEIDLESAGKGIDLAKNAMRLKPAPVVIMSSADPNESKLRAAMGLGVSYLVLKPIDLAELKGALHRSLLLRQSRSSRAPAY